MGLSNGFEVSNVPGGRPEAAGGRPEAAGGRLEAIRGHFHALYSVIYYVGGRHNSGYKSELWWLLNGL